MEKVTIVEYDVKQRNELVTEDKRFNDTQYSSWKAYSVGTAPATVDGLVLQPGEGIEHVLQPCEKWKESIVISGMTSGSAVRLMREICTPRAKTYYDRSGK